MFRNSWIAALAAAFACVVASNAAPLEAYGKLPTLTNMTLSPNGARLAYVRPVLDKRLVVALDLATGKTLGLINVTGSKLRNLQWADNHNLIITTSMTTRPAGFIGHKKEYFLAESYDLETKKQRALLERVGGISGPDDIETMNVVLGVPQPRIIDGHTVLFVRGIFFPANTGYPALFSIDLTEGKTRMVSSPRDIHAEDWAVDEHGKIVAESSYWEKEQHWKLHIFHDREAVQVMDEPASIEQPDLEGLNEDGTGVIISTPNADGGYSFREVALKDGAISPWARSDLGFGNVVTMLSTGRVIGGTRISEKNDYIFFDAHADKIWRSIKASFKNATDLDLVSWSDDRNKVVVHAFGADYGEAYYYVDMQTHAANMIGLAYEDITDVAPQRWITYKAADGRDINAYLTLPLGAEPKNAALIVLPHGGPHTRDMPGFDWMAQALASRGYVVLQPQFRGSDGFGPDLLHAGFGEFGKKMQTDLSDGVRALAAQGLIDPKRVCIAGASYGGYAALAGATFDTGVYRCAVSIAGLSDLHDQLRYWHGPGGADRSDRFWDRFLGVEDYDDPKLNDISPIKHVDKVSIPILLIHGKDDTVVPYAQSDDMADELKNAKKPYEFVTLKGEDHWLSKSETRLQMLEAVVKFLESHNPPKSPGPVAAAQ